MKLSPLQIEPDSLAALAAEVTQLLIAGKYSEVAAEFGYAVALGRNPAAAIREDLVACLSHLGATQLDPDSQPVVQVKYFKPEDQLFAVAECALATMSGHRLLAELVVSVAGNDFYATLEQISAEA